MIIYVLNSHQRQRVISIFYQNNFTGTIAKYYLIKRISIKIKYFWHWIDFQRKIKKRFKTTEIQDLLSVAEASNAPRLSKYLLGNHEIMILIFWPFFVFLGHEAVGINPRVYYWTTCIIRIPHSQLILKLHLYSGIMNL